MFSTGENKSTGTPNSGPTCENNNNATSSVLRLFDHLHREEEPGHSDVGGVPGDQVEEEGGEEAVLGDHYHAEICSDQTRDFLSPGN